MELIFDLETDGLLDSVTKIHCLVTKDAQTGEVCRYDSRDFSENEPVNFGVEKLAKADLLVAHNGIGYDLIVLQRFYPWFRPKKVRDTMVISRLIWPHRKDLDFDLWRKGTLPGQLLGRHSLESWGHRLGKLKGDFHKSSDWKTFSPEMLQYCQQDVEVTAALWDLIKRQEFSETSIELEQSFFGVIRHMEEAGFPFNKPAAAELYSKLCKRRLELSEQLKEAFPIMYEETEFVPKANNSKLGYKKGVAVIKRKGMEFNPASRPDIGRRLIDKYGWVPVLRTDTGRPKIDESVLETLEYPEAKLLNEYLMIQKRIGQLAEGDNAWLKLEKNGRIHGRLNTNGCYSGRCSHEKPNLSQTPAIDKPYGAEMRALFTAPNGWKLVGVDAEGIQLRALAHFAALYDGGAYREVVLNGDPHTKNQKAAGLPTRAKAKTFIYCWLMGGGPYLLGETAGVTPEEMPKLRAHPLYEAFSQQKRFKDLSKDELCVAVKGEILNRSFLNNTPALKQFREDVDKRGKARKYLIGLDKRRIPIRALHAAVSFLLQNFEAVIMKRATVMIWDRLHELGHVHGIDWQWCAFSHDEWQIAAKLEIAELVAQVACKAIEDSAASFEARCPCKGKSAIGNNWKDTH